MNFFKRLSIYIRRVLGLSYPGRVIFHIQNTSSNQSSDHKLNTPVIREGFQYGPFCEPWERGAGGSAEPTFVFQTYRITKIELSDRELSLNKDILDYIESHWDDFTKDYSQYEKETLEKLKRKFDR